MNSYLKEEVKALLTKADSYYYNGKYIKALLTYNQVLVFSEMNYRAYFGMYQSWVAYCLKIKQDSPIIDELWRSAYKYAPSKIKQVYLKVYEKDVKKLKKMEQKGNE